MTKTIIRANSSISLSFQELRQFRDLFFILILRDIKLRYKQTFLGIAWVVMQPLLTSLLFALLFGKLVSMPSNGLPYMLFTFAGLLPWLFVSQAIFKGSGSLLVDARLITKVYFPRLLIPFASCMAVLVDFGVSFITMVALLFLYKIPLTYALLLIPFFLFIAMILAIGISLFFSAINVYYRDFVHMLAFMMQIGLYLSPVAYASSLIPAKWERLYALNPMVGIIDGFRFALLGMPNFPFFSFVSASIVSLSIFLAGIFFFKRMERGFTDVI